MSEWTLSIFLLTLLLGYFIANASFSYFIIKDKTLGDFQRILMVVLFWTIPFTGFVIYPLHLLISRGRRLS